MLLSEMIPESEWIPLWKWAITLQISPLSQLILLTLLFCAHCSFLFSLRSTVIY